MKTLQVIRVENSSGVGMFRADFGTYEISSLKDMVSRHFDYKENCDDIYFPRPEQEGIEMTKDSKEWFCAFRSLEQFNSLIFDSEAKVLIENGFNVLLLSVTNYQLGDNQIAFTKESITKSENINTLFS